MIELTTKMVDILKMDPEAAKILKSCGLCCATCSGSKHDTVQMGAINHGMDANELLAKLNNLLPA